MTITYVKSDYAMAAAGVTTPVVVDLGLGIDEAARILGISLEVGGATKFEADQVSTLEAAYSFDPEDVLIEPTDDEQFAYLCVVISAITASTGAMKQTENYFLDFSRMNLITTRNLAFLVASAAAAMTAKGTGRVYYEKYKPPVAELTQLIATRR